MGTPILVTPFWLCINNSREDPQGNGLRSVRWWALEKTVTTLRNYSKVDCEHRDSSSETVDRGITSKPIMEGVRFLVRALEVFWFD